MGCSTRYKGAALSLHPRHLSDSYETISHERGFVQRGSPIPQSGKPAKGPGRCLSRNTTTTVTIIERDHLPKGAETRKDTPQSRHGHGLLAGGYQIIERLLSGFGAEAIANGALPCDVIANARWFQLGGYKAQFQSGLEGILMSRPLIEAVIRRRVLAIPNVTVVANGVKALCANAGQSRVTGVRLMTGEELTADLVVDASGRGSKAPAWLEALGYAKPIEEQIKMDVGYAMRIFRRRPTDLNGDLAAFATPTAPHQTRIGFAVAMEGDYWIVALGGWLGDHAPTDLEGWIEFARTLPRPTSTTLSKMPSQLAKRWCTRSHPTCAGATRHCNAARLVSW